MEDLKTNYVDDVLDTSKNQLRKYNMIQNDDGTVSFIDTTSYTTSGTSFGASDVNSTNKAVNQLNDDLSELNKSLEDKSTEINTKLATKSNLLTVADVQSSSQYSLAGGENGNVAIDVKKTGYKTLGVVGFTTQSSHIMVGRINFTSTDTVEIFIKNTASGTISKYIILRVLYVKS